MNKDKIRIGKEIEIQPNYRLKKDLRDFPTSPSDDVEKILSVGRFDDKVNAIVKPYFKPEDEGGLRPWGETPLYLALVKGLDDFAIEGNDRRKCLVVITDGINDTDAATTSEQVVRAAKKSNVHVYILGFDIKPNEDNDQNKIDKAIREFEYIAKETKGEFVPIKSGTQLLNKLEEQLGTDTYQVLESGQPAAKLNAETPIDDSYLWKLLSVSFHSVSFHSPPKKVRLEGGEAIQLYVEGKGQDPKIVAKPYEAGEKEGNLLDNDGKVSPFILRVRSPQFVIEKDLVNVTFPISLQRDPRAYHFTERPVETWVEITPVAENAQPYVFYDTNFEPDKPVPVLKWTASDWPKEATEARVRFWCKFADRREENPAGGTSGSSAWTRSRTLRRVERRGQ